MNKKIYGVRDIGNILMIKAEESILQELLDLFDKNEQCKIIDLTQYISGSMCTLLLCDYGAEVIKVEESLMQYDTMTEEDKCARATFHRGKRSVILNLDEESDRTVFRSLCKGANAVVEDFSPGTIEKWGITFDALRIANPSIVYTSISGYGQTGPYASHAAFDQTIQAESEVMSITGEAGGTPVKCGASIADFSGGLAACVGTLMGLYDAQRSGSGRRIDVAMMDSLVFGLENQFSSYLRTGEIPKPRGNYVESALPSGAYRCKDGVRLMVSVYTDEQWENFCEALERCGWHPQKEWMSKAQRLKDHRVIEEQIKCIFLAYTSNEMEKILLEKNVSVEALTILKE